MKAREPLQAFVRTGDEGAFSRLVETYGGLVLGTALRQVGDRPLAEEIAQEVFSTLARKARTIRDPERLGAWLHRTTVFHSANAVRKESRRRENLARYQREQTGSMNEEELAEWNEALPLLDAAISELPAVERQLVVMRFFEGCSFKVIGRVLEKSEDASRKQLSRILEKLSQHLSRKGAGISAGLVATGLAAQMGYSMAPSLVDSIARTALAAAGSGSGQGLGLGSLFGLTKTWTVAVTSLAFFTPIGVQWAKNHRGHQSREAERPSVVGTAPRLLGWKPGTGNRSMVGEGGGRTEMELSRIMVALSQHSNPDRVRYGLCQFLLTLSKVELPRAMKCLPRLRDANDRRAIANALFSRWVSFDPHEAIREARDCCADYDHTFGAEWGTIRAWVSRDRAEAKAWLDTLPEGAGKDRLVGAYWYGFGKTDPSAAAEAAMALSDEREGVDRLEKIMRLWQEQDPLAALDWLGRVDDGARKDQWVANGIEALSVVHPDKASEIVMATASGYRRQQLMTEVLRNWARVDPDQAVETLLGLPSDTLTNELVSAVGAWLDDPLAARTTWEALSEERKDAFFLGLVRGARFGRYDRSAPGLFPDWIRWADGQADSEHREESLNILASSWLRADEKAARAWIESTGSLSDRNRKWILESVNERW
ncbi:MAG: sigma-70 family RNA polymerase sigma factor [Verrucomicrobiota bacterium]